MFGSLLASATEFAERGHVPDSLVRFAIRRLCAQRLGEERARQSAAGRVDFAARLSDEPIAVRQEAANEQHYEVPAEFFRLVLGPRLKYSCCLWSSETPDLEAAERDMLELTVERARLGELGQGARILELGCGWGSLTLWMAENFPHLEILAVSNSSSQRRYIEQQCSERDLFNVEVRTVDVTELELPERHFARVISVEMFEHLRNWRGLLERIESWLEVDGRLFLHFFCHRQFGYLYSEQGAGNWMGRTFFSGGLMPSYDLLRQLEQPLSIEQQWKVSGLHYAKTCNAWLALLDQHRGEIEQLFSQVYGADSASRWVQRWRMFFMACAELFDYASGEEWMVCHALLEPKR